MNAIIKVTLILFTLAFSHVSQASDSDVRYIKALKHDRFSDHYILKLQGIESDNHLSHCSTFLLDGAYDFEWVMQLKKAVKESRQVVVSSNPPSDGSMILVSGDGCMVTGVRLI